MTYLKNIKTETLIKMLKISSKEDERLIIDELSKRMPIGQLCSLCEEIEKV